MWKNCKFVIINGFGLESKRKAQLIIGSESASAFVDFNLTTGRGMFSLEGISGVIDMTTGKKVKVPKRISLKNVSPSTLKEYAESKFKNCGVKKLSNFFWDHYFISNEELRVNGNLVARLYDMPDGTFSAEILKPRSEFFNFKKIHGDDKNILRYRAEEMARSFGWSV